MSQVFILQNQNQYFLNKHREWIDGHDAGLVYRTPHKDIALNEMIEVNSKDITQRIRILECEVNSRNHPLIDEEDLPPPAPKEEAATEDDSSEIHAETDSGISDTTVVVEASPAENDEPIQQEILQVLQTA